MLFIDEKLPRTLPMLGQWRLLLLKAVVTFHNYSTAACEAAVVVSFCNEILLRAALAFTRSLTLYLSVLLKLNTFIRQKLAGVLLAREDLDQHACSSCCSTWPPSHTLRNYGCPPSGCGGRRSAEPLKPIKAVLLVLPALCRFSLSLCLMSFALVQVAVSLLPCLWSNLRRCVSTVTALRESIRPIVSVFLEFGTSGGVSLLWATPKYLQYLNSLCNLSPELNTLF